MSKPNASFLGIMSLVLAGLLAGCTSSTSDGPLIAGGDPSEICAVQPENGMAAFGNIVQNGGESALTINKVSLVEAANLEIRAAYVMPMAGSSSFVLATGSTEPTDPDEQAAWQSAVDVESYEIAPGEHANIVLALDNGDEESGTSRALRIDYEQDNAPFFAESTMTLTLADESCR